MKVTLDAALKRRKMVRAKAEALNVILDVYRVAERHKGGSAVEKPTYDYKKNQDGTNLVTATVPRLDREQVEAEQKFYAVRYRLLDEKIQEANNTTEVEVEWAAVKDAILILDDDQLQSEDGSVMVSRKLSSLLSIRKELNEKSDAPHAPTLIGNMKEIITRELKCGESADELAKEVVKITGGELLHEAFTRGTQMCAVDTAIAKANAETMIDVPEKLWEEYVQK